MLKAGGAQNSEIEDLISMVVGEKVVPYRSDAPEAVDGYVYPLLTEGARQRYTNVLAALGYLGFSRAISDYPQSIAAQGTKTANALSPEGVIPFALGATTPIKMMTPEQQRLKQVLMATTDGRSMIKAIDDAVTSDILTETTKVETAEKAKLAEGSREYAVAYAKAYNSLNDFDKEALRIQSDALKIKSDIMKDPGNYDAYVEKYKKLQDEMKELNAQRKAWKEANAKK
jgi:hypothetical protein